MIGQYIVFYNDKIDHQLVAARLAAYIVGHRDIFAITTHQSDSMLMAHVMPRCRERGNVYNNRADWVNIDGFVFNNRQIVTAQDIYKYVKETGDVDYLTKMNGEFLVTICIEGRAYLITDRMGQRQYYISKSDQLTTISPSPRLHHYLTGRKPQLNKRAMMAFIVTNKLRLNYDTIWDDTKVLPPAASITYLDSKLHINHYWQMKYSPNTMMTCEESVEHFTSIFNNAVKIRIFDKLRMGITLTGGLDSRVMLGAVPSAKRPLFLASTMGIPGCNEITIAKVVADNLQVRYRPFYIEPQTVFEADNLRYFKDEDCDQLIQALWKPYTASLKDVDILMHGLDLDVTFGGIYLTSELAAVKSWNDLISYAVRNALSVSPEMFNMLFRKQVIDKIDYNPRKLVMQSLKDCDEGDFLNTYDHFIMQYSMFRVILQRYRAIRSTVETISPMYDRDLIDLYLMIPPQLRMNYNIFQKFVKKLSFKLSQITYQRISLPPTAPIASWRKAQMIDGQIEELYREIAHSTNGDVYVPFQKYYTNIDEWLRFNPIWMKATHVLLQSPTSILRNEWLNAEYLDTLITAHQRHVCSYMKIIHLLISAEVYLRMAAGCTIEEIQKAIS